MLMSQTFGWVCCESKLDTKNRSPVWKKYHEAIDLDQNIPVVVCKKCPKWYKHPRSLNDSAITTMLKHSRKRDYVPMQVSTAGSIEQFLRHTSEHNSISMKDLEELLLETMAACNWPFSQFDRPEFQYFISRLVPGQTCSGRKRMKTLLTKAAEMAREEIRVRVSSCTSKISLALDCWSSSNSYSFMSIFHS